MPYKWLPEQQVWLEVDGRGTEIGPAISVVPPTWYQRMRSFVKARRVWKAAGKPVRSTARIKEIYETHCQPCPLNINDCCTRCGCGVSHVEGIFNKLTLATEGCPDTPPRFPPDVAPQEATDGPPQDHPDP